MLVREFDFQPHHPGFLRCSGFGFPTVIPVAANVGKKVLLGENHRRDE